MAGKNTNKEKLNHTLERVCGILNENNIPDWFIFFGTLLGIVRENSCIAKDNDLDFLVKHDYQELREIFEKEGFEFIEELDSGEKKTSLKTRTILKTRDCKEYASVDFYMCNIGPTGKPLVIKEGNFYAKWHNTVVVDPKPFVTKKWRSTTLNLPNNYIQKIITMYGEDWKTPRGGSCPINLMV